MKKHYYIFLLIFISASISSCGLLGESRHDKELEKELRQENFERNAKKEMLNSFTTLGLYEPYTFTKVQKYQTKYHKRLNELYEAKYQMQKHGYFGGDSMKRVNKEIDTLRTYMDKNGYRTLYKLEHLGGFSTDSTLELIRGDYYFQGDGKIDSSQINFATSLPIKYKEAFEHFIYRKPYSYNGYTSVDKNERLFYNLYHDELWNRRFISSSDEALFLKHTCKIVRIMLANNEYNIDWLTKKMIDYDIKEKEIFKRLIVSSYGDLIQLDIEEINGVRRKIYERQVKFSYLLADKVVNDSLLYQFNEYLEIVN